MPWGEPGNHSSPRTSPGVAGSQAESLRIKASMTAPETKSLPPLSALTDFDNLPDAAFVRPPVVAALFSVSMATVWRWTKAGHIPAPVKLGPNSTGWRVGELRGAMSALGVA